MNLKTTISEKEFEELKSATQKTEWYRQAGKIKPVYVITPCFGVIDELKYQIIECYSTEFEGFYDLKGLAAEAKGWFKKTKKSTVAIDAYYTIFEKIVRKIRAALAAAEKLDFQKAEKKEIAKIITRLDTFNREMWRNCFLPDKFDPEGDILLKQEVKRHNQKITQEEINILVRPQELNFIEESNKELAGIALTLIRRESSDYDTVLKPFVKKYYFIQNSWESVKNVSEKDFIGPLKELIERGAERIEILRGSFENRGTETKQKCEQLCTKYAIPQELKNVFHLFRVLAMIRDQRKEYVLRFNHFYERAVERCTSDFGLQKERLYDAAPTELVHLLETGRIDVVLLKERSKNAIWFKRENQDFIIGGAKAQGIMDILHKKLLEKHEELKGMVASTGNAKTVTGTAKIILGETHFTKFNAGDILVAPMTRPEYVPLMKKAKAIITDEGGITCHAAIVSRELGVPCIIGTQVATKKLQDNRTVEIDVVKGIVRMVE